MQKLNESLSIEKWMKIADDVQSLELNDFDSEEEYKNNLRVLQSCLKKLEINSAVGERKPEHSSGIGVSTLLESIYNLNLEMWRSNRARFYEFIYSLNYLGIKNVKFRPADFSTSILELFEKSYHESVNPFYYTSTAQQYVRELNTAFTDGTFSFSKDFSKEKGYLNEICKSSYDFYGLKDANFLIKHSLKKVNDNDWEILESSIELKNFRGNLPSKKEVLAGHLPKIFVPTQTVSLNGFLKNVKEVYETIDINEVSLTKKLSQNKRYYD